MARHIIGHSNNRQNIWQSNPPVLTAKCIIFDDRTNTADLSVDLPQAANNDACPTSTKRNYKTELCKHYIQWVADSQGQMFHCPYGDKCNFAHGESELARFTNAYEMHAHGIIENPDTYLCLPCFDHVATGSCPMGVRCHSLHDPRVTGSSPGWLRNVCKKPKQNPYAIPDTLYHHRDISRFQTNPLVGYHAWKLFQYIKADPFQATYDLVCNIGVPFFDTRFISPQPSTKLTQVQKLCIVRAMQRKCDLHFIYSSENCINGQACLVLQTRYFRLLPPKVDATTVYIEDIVQEISFAEYDPNSNVMVHANEIVFDSKGKQNCNRSIWFDANVMRFGGRIIKRQYPGRLWHHEDKAFFCMPNNKQFELSLPTITPHFLMQSKDDCDEGYDLINAILEHRINSILAAQGYQFFWVNHIAALKADFDRLQKSAHKWMWPSLDEFQVNKIFQTTREEHTASSYVPPADKNVILSAIWATFVKEHQTEKRLDVFISLTTNVNKCSYKQLPHITNSSSKFISYHSERTWKELLLGDDGPWRKAKANVDFESRSQSKALASSRTLIDKQSQ